jgi:ankyrin repeat protein
MLHAAAIGGNSELVEFFISKGADINATDSYGSTPLHLAVERERISIIELFIKLRANMEIRNNEGDTPLMIAARKEYKGYTMNKMTKMLIAGRAKVDANVRSLIKTGLMPLHIAAKAGNFDEVQSLISDRANVNVKDKRGLGPLHYAATGGYLEIAKLLIDNGAQVGATYEHDFTPLLTASSEGHKDIVELLLDNGADINRISSGRTALGEAALNGHRDVVEFLLSKGADIRLGDLGEHVSLQDTTKRDFIDLAEKLVGKYGPYSIIVTDPDSVRQLLKYWRIDFDDVWIPEEEDLEGFGEAVRARLEDPTEIKAKPHFRRKFILRYFDQYSREYSGIMRNENKHVICQMILQSHFPAEPPDNTFTQIHGYANGVVRVVLDLKTKKVVEIDCEYWM